MSKNVIITGTSSGIGFELVKLFSENNNNWHHAVLTKKNYEDAIKELEQNVI